MMSAELHIVERSFEFAVRVVRLCRFLETQDRVSRTLANQLLRAGTSIGANVEEAQAGQSKAGYIDSWGRGAEKISEACKASGLPAPVFTERSGGVLVELLRPQSKRDGETATAQKTTQKTAQKMKNTAQKILDLLREDPQTSRRQIAESLGDITEDGVKYHLDKLKKAGTIRRIGADKGGHWEVIDS